MNTVVQKQFDKIKGLHTITFHTEGQRLSVCGNYQLTFSNKGDISLHLGNRFPGPAFTFGQVILIAGELVVDLKMITLHPQSIVEGVDECHAPDVTAMIDDLKSFCSQVNDYFIQSAVRHFALNKLLCYVSEGCVAVNTSPITKIPYALLIDMEAGSPPWYSHPPQVL